MLVSSAGSSLTAVRQRQGLFFFLYYSSCWEVIGGCLSLVKGKRHRQPASFDGDHFNSNKKALINKPPWDGDAPRFTHDDTTTQERMCGARRFSPQNRPPNNQQKHKSARYVPTTKLRRTVFDVRAHAETEVALSRQHVLTGGLFNYNSLKTLLRNSSFSQLVPKTGQNTWN